MKPFLILQLRPETEASDNEFEAFLDKGELRKSDVKRVRLDQEQLSAGLALQDYSGVIVGGGPGCVSDAPDEKSPLDQKMEMAVKSLMPEITDADFPFLGCCYGIGILADHLNAKVSKEQYGEEVGPVECTLAPEGRDDPLLEGFPGRLTVFTGHKEALQELPDGCSHLMASEPCPFQMIRYKRNVYATQFHPEADSDVFEVRIRVYRDAGYFAPEDADQLVAACRAAEAGVSGRILKNFVDAYGREGR